MDNFVPRHIILRSIELLGRCKCDLCQKEKKKREDMLFPNKQVKETVIQVESKPPEKE